MEPVRAATSDAERTRMVMVEVPSRLSGESEVWRKERGNKERFEGCPSLNLASPLVALSEHSQALPQSA